MVLEVEDRDGIDVIFPCWILLLLIFTLSVNPTYTSEGYQNIVLKRFNCVSLLYNMTLVIRVILLHYWEVKMP